VVWEDKIRAGRKERSWFDPAADKVTPEDNIQREEDLAADRRKRSGKKQKRDEGEGE